MIQLFKSANKTITPILIAVCIVLLIPSLYRSANLPLGQGYFIHNFISSFLKYFNNYQATVSWVFGTAIIIYQVLLFNYLCNRYEVLPLKSNLPGYAFILIIAIIQESYFGSPASIGLIFLLYSFRSFLKGYVEAAEFHHFNSSIFAGIALLLEPGYLPWIIVLFYNVIQNRAIRFKTVLLVIIGLLIPYYFVISGLYLFDLVGLQTYFYSTALLPSWNFAIFTNLYQALTVALLLVIIIIGGYSIAKGGLGYTTLRIRKSMQVTIWILLSAIIGFVFYSNYAMNLGLFIMPASLLLAATMIEFKKPILAELYNIFIISVTIFLVLSSYQLLPNYF